MTFTKEIKAEVMEAIREHMRTHGTKDWHLVRDRWPEFLAGDTKSANHKRFYRLQREAREAGAAPGEVRQDAVRRARAATKKNVPAPPSPASMLAGGRSADRGIEIMDLLHTTLSDIMLTRSSAVKVEEDGTEKVKNAQLLDRSIGRRLEVVNTFLNVFREVYDLQQMRSFYDEIVSIIVEEIHPIEPVIAQRIMERLKALNDRELMTIHATA